jgi:hypothetical protein
MSHRYWAVTNIDYAHQRTGQRIGVMIVILWVLSFLVSIAPMFGWKDSVTKILRALYLLATMTYFVLLYILFIYDDEGMEHQIRKL